MNGLAGTLAGATVDLAAAGDDLADDGTLLVAVAGRPAASVMAAAWRRHGAATEHVDVDGVALVWDRAARRGVLARGRSGSRALLWDGARFATDPASFVALGGPRPRPDALSAVTWLTRAQVPPRRSLLDGVARLLAGERLELGPGGATRTVRHWPRPYEEAGAPSRDEAAALLAESVRDAVARASDGSLGVMLSGGFDSATVAAVAPRPLRAFTATFPGAPEADESAQSRATAAALGVELVAVEARSGSPIRAALAYTGRWLSPLPSPNGWVWDRVLAAAAERGVETMLDGEGGDELFGPAVYLLSDLLRTGRLRAARREAEALVGPELARRALYRFGLVGAVPPRLHEAIRRARKQERYAPAWLRPEAAAALHGGRDRWLWKERPGPRWWAQRVYELTDQRDAYGAHELARQRAAVHGVRAVHPLFDPDLVDAVLRLPPGLAHDPDRDRPLARDALAGVVPEHVLQRRTKARFNAAQEAWLVAERPLLDRLLAPGEALVGEWVVLDAVREWALGDPRHHPAGRLRWPLDVWRVVALELFLRELGAPGWCAAHLSAA